MRWPNRDNGHLLTIEALIAAFLLIGAAHFVSHQAQPALTGLPQARLDSAAHDAAAGLTAREERLEALLSDAYRCAHGRAPTSACEEAEARTARAVEPYLPTGTRFDLTLSNGQGTQALHTPGQRPGASSTASFMFAPIWNYTFVTTDLSCHDPDAGLRVHALPLRAGAAPPLAELHVASPDGSTYASTRHSDGWWSADVPTGVSAPVAGVSAGGESRGLAYAGHAALDACALGTMGSIVRQGLASSTFGFDTQAGNSSVPPGGRVGLRYDLSPLLEVAPTVAVRSVAVDVHAPVPPLGAAPAVVSHVELGTAATGSSTWRAPTSSLFGLHPAVLRVALDVPLVEGVASVEVRLVASLLVTLPHGETADNPPYRISVTAWWLE